jgi:hypothetical protein
VWLRPEGVRGNVLGLGRVANGTSRPRRGLAAHGKAVAGAWLGLAVVQRGGGSARLMVRVRTHARVSWLPRAAAWPCRPWGTDIPGLRHDATAMGCRGGATGSCMKGRHGGWMGEGVLGLATAGLLAALGITPATGEKEGRERRRRSPRARRQETRSGGRPAQVGRGRAGCAASLTSLSGHQPGGARVRCRPSLGAAPPPLLLPSSSAGAAAAEGENRGLLGLGKRLGVLYSVLGFWERLW